MLDELGGQHVSPPGPAELAPRPRDPSRRWSGRCVQLLLRRLEPVDDESSTASAEHGPTRVGG